MARERTIQLYEVKLTPQASNAAFLLVQAGPLEDRDDMKRRRQILLELRQHAGADEQTPFQFSPKMGGGYMELEAEHFTWLNKHLDAMLKSKTLSSQITEGLDDLDEALEAARKEFNQHVTKNRIEEATEAKGNGK